MTKLIEKIRLIWMTKTKCPKAKCNNKFDYTIKHYNQCIQPEVCFLCPHYRHATKTTESDYGWSRLLWPKGKNNNNKCKARLIISINRWCSWCKSCNTGAPCNKIRQGNSLPSLMPLATCPVRGWIVMQNVRIPNVISMPSSVYSLPWWVIVDFTNR